jgi:release factor glutamine methyltransferase
VSTFVESVRRGAHALEQAGWSPDDGLRDAEALARHIVRWDAAAWLARRRDIAPPAFETAFDAAVARRLHHEPVAYIVGAREFYGRPFRVTPEVLIPRPETELVVDEARALLSGRAQEWPGLAVVDIGTGSGCVAITLALEVPSIRVVATDISAGALDVARTNAEALGATNRVCFVQASIVDGLTGPFDLIVSNPPYVSRADAATLMPDVRDHEPAAALFGGRDGLDVVRAVVNAAGTGLRPGGRLVMEIGAGQADKVKTLIAEAGLALQHVRRDLADIPRVIVAQQPMGL